MQIENIQVVRGHNLEDQVLTGTQASFQAKVDVDPLGTPYFLRWTFMGSTSSWQGPFTGSPSGSFAFNISDDAQHRLDEPLTVEARCAVDGATGDTLSRNMRVFFDVDATNDDHNRPLFNSDPNWFRHWGIDQDGAISAYAAKIPINYFGKNVSFYFGGSGKFAQYNSLPDDAKIALFDQSRQPFAPPNGAFVSQAMSYRDSQGNMINAPAGAITLNFNVSGIDNVAFSIFHEVCHLRTDLRWLPPNGEWFLLYGIRQRDNGDGVLQTGENDFDDDELPNAVEDVNPGFRWDQKATNPTFYLKSFDQTQGEDEELWCEIAGNSTPRGTIVSRDWAFEGKQSTPSN